MPESKQQAAAADSWLTAIGGLAANPVYNVMRLRHRVIRSDKFLRRLRFPSIFAILALTLTWLIADVTQIQLDPSLLGVTRLQEWLYLCGIALHDAPLGLGQLVLALAVSCALIWFIASTYAWIIECGRLLGRAVADKHSELQIAVDASSASPRSVVIGFTIGALSAWLPLIILSSLAYSFILFMLKFNDGLTLSSEALYYLVPNLPSLLLCAVGVAVGFCLALVLNTLLLLKNGSSTHRTGLLHIAALLMVCAQFSYAIHAPSISLELHQGISQTELWRFWANLLTVSGLLVGGMLVGIVITRFSSTARARYIALWPTLLLAAVWCSPAISAFYGLIAYGDIGHYAYNVYTATKLAPAIIFGVGGFLNLGALLYNGTMEQSDAICGIRGPASVPVITQVFLLYVLLQFGLIAIAAQGAYRAVAARYARNR